MSNELEIAFKAGFEKGSESQLNKEAGIGSIGAKMLKPIKYIGEGVETALGKAPGGGKIVEGVENLSNAGGIEASTTLGTGGLLSGVGAYELGTYPFRSNNNVEVNLDQTR